MPSSKPGSAPSAPSTPSAAPVAPAAPSAAPQAAPGNNECVISIEYSSPDGNTHFKFSTVAAGTMSVGTSSGTPAPFPANGQNGQGPVKNLYTPAPGKSASPAGGRMSMVKMVTDPDRIVKTYPKGTISTTVISSVALDVKNTTSSPLVETLNYQSTVNFDSVSEVNNYRKQVDQADLDFKTEVAFDGVTSSIGMKYSQMVESYYSSKDTVQEFKEVVTTQTFTINLQPGDQFTLYKVTESAGSYENVYYTTTNAATTNEQLNYTMLADLSQACISFITQVANVGGRNSDYDEWAFFTNNASTALALQNTLSVVGVMNKFITLNLGLWTSGEDQGSWGSVLNGMKQANAATDAYAKFSNMISGFLPITNPSHNGSLWDGLRNAALQYNSL